MKTLRSLILCISIGLLFTFCKGDEELVQTEEERVSALLTAGTWNSSVVSLDGSDISTEFNTFTIIFSRTTYSTDNGGDLWPPNGTWKFTDQTATKILRDDGIEMTITQISSSSLTVTFTSNERIIRSGKLVALEGDYVFQFSK